MEITPLTKGCFSIFADRIGSFRLSVGLDDRDIVGCNDTPKWRFLKKQTMIALRQHGDGLKHLESMTLKYGEQMLQKMEDLNGEAFDPKELIHITTASIMLTLVYARSTEEDIKKLLQCQEQLMKVYQSNGAYQALDILPVLRFIVPPIKKAFAEFISVTNNGHKVFENLLAARRKTYQHPQVECFTDHFLKLHRMSKTEEDKYKKVDQLDIRIIGMDMLSAGVMTTTKTLQMMLAVLVNHPQIQDDLHNEIVEVIGERNPSIEDRTCMPFTEAVILETLRYHSVAMFAIPHLARCDTELNGYLIPKGTYIFPNLWALHHDDRYWEQPWEFNPHRWIENGMIVGPNHKNKQRMLAFGAGRRQCGGEVFARNRLFILTCLMLQKFKFEAAEGHERPNHDPRDCHAELLLMMKPYKLSVQLRK